MDQNSSNDPDKRNWRDRLGIGQKEMPRISGDFNRAEPALDRERQAEVRGTQPMPVARPAPMAPRVAPRQAPASQQAPRQPAPVEQPRNQPQAPAHRPQRQSPPQPNEVLSEKLRNQRAAAEKLAEQRVVAAKGRAEAARNAPPPAVPQRPPQPRAVPLPEVGQPNKPKFSFAEEEARREEQSNRRDAREAWPAARPSQPPPPVAVPHLAPPRPALGGDRPLPGQRPPASPTGYQPAYRPQPPQGYRPVDPATGYPPPPPAQRQYPVPPTAYGQPSGYEPQGYVPAQRFNPEAYHTAGDEHGYAPTPAYPPPAARPRRDTALRAPRRPGVDEFEEEFFEETPPPGLSRRASVSDYNQAYQEHDPYYDDERKRKSKSPVFALAILAVVAFLVGAGFYAYNNFFKTSSTTASGSTGTTPVVTAPEQPARSSGETIDATANQGQSGATPSRKQIYDRIIGDQEVLGGSVNPTEETPIPPDSSESMSGNGTANQPTAGVQGSNTPAGQQPANSQSGTAGAIEEPLPMAMPPPPGSGTGSDVQGAIPSPMTNQSVATNTTASSSVAPASSAPQAQQSAARDSTAPLATPTTAGAANSSQATPPSASAPATEEITADDPPAAAPKSTAKQTAAKTPKASKGSEKLGSAPVVLVAPSVPTTPVSNSQVATTQIAPPPPLPQATTPAQSVTTPAQPKKKTLFGLLTGNNDETTAADNTVTASTPAAPAQAASTSQESLPLTAPSRQVAAITPKPSVAAQSKPAIASGYYAKLSLANSQADAQSKFARMKSKNPAALGSYSASYVPVDVGGTTRYQLLVGPMSSRDQVSQLCSSLLTAGENDCTISNQ